MSPAVSKATQAKLPGQNKVTGLRGSSHEKGLLLARQADSHGICTGHGIRCSKVVRERVVLINRDGFLQPHSCTSASGGKRRRAGGAAAWLALDHRPWSCSVHLRVHRRG